MCLHIPLATDMHAHWSAHAALQTPRWKLRRALKRAPSLGRRKCRQRQQKRRQPPRSSRRTAMQVGRRAACLAASPRTAGAGVHVLRMSTLRVFHGAVTTLPLQAMSRCGCPSWTWQRCRPPRDSACRPHRRWASARAPRPPPKASPSRPEGRPASFAARSRGTSSAAPLRSEPGAVDAAAGPRRRKYSCNSELHGDCLVRADARALQSREAALLSAVGLAASGGGDNKTQQRLCLPALSRLDCCPVQPASGLL